MRYIWTVMLTIYVVAPQLTQLGIGTDVRLRSQKLSGCSLRFIWTVVMLLPPQLTQFGIGIDMLMLSC